MRTPPASLLYSGSSPFFFCRAILTRAHRSFVAGFLAPESWVNDPSGKGQVLHSNTYLCMETPSPSRQPGVMNGEDSY